MFIWNPYKNFKHIKAFKYDDERKIDKDDESDDDSEDSILIIVPLRCDCCNENYELVYDEFHGDVICTRCGCVIHSNVLL